MFNTIIDPPYNFGISGYGKDHEQRRYNDEEMK